MVLHATDSIDMITDLYLNDMYKSYFGYGVSKGNNKIVRIPDVMSRC